jgi:hypothetical protein
VPIDEPTQLERDNAKRNAAKANRVRVKAAARPMDWDAAISRLLVLLARIDGERTSDRPTGSSGTPRWIGTPPLPQRARP